LRTFIPKIAKFLGIRSFEELQYAQNNTNCSFLTPNYSK
jgi:hypothetical protein